MTRPATAPALAALLGTVLTVALTVVLGAGPAQADRVRRLGGVDVTLSRGVRQVVTVHHTAGYHARVSWWVKRASGWKRTLVAHDGRIGYGGLVVGTRRQQGTGTTPLGTYRLPWAFGTHARHAGWSIGYRRIRQGDFWVEDNASAYYNRYRNQAQGGFRWRLSTNAANGSERLSDYPRQYEFAVVTSFNHDQVRHRGAGIFLHVNGSGATAGCVSAPRWFLAKLMSRLDPHQHPVIAIGR